MVNEISRTCKITCPRTFDWMGIGYRIKYWLIINKCKLVDGW